MQITEETKKLMQLKRIERKNKKEVNVNGKIYNLNKVPAYKREFYLRLEKCRTPLRAIKLKCYECSNYSDNEALNCPCIDCPLYVYLHQY